jgi:hypothetical protein
MTESDKIEIFDRQLAWLNQHPDVITILAHGQPLMLRLLDAYVRRSERDREQIRTLVAKYWRVFWYFLDGRFISGDEKEIVLKMLIWLSIIGVPGDPDWMCCVADYCNEAASKVVSPRELAEFLCQAAAISSPEIGDFFLQMAQHYEKR